MLNNVSANRMTLLKLRKRLTMARRGHSLMKHKLDELIHIFQKEIRKVMQMRKEVDDLLNNVYRQFLLGKGLLREEALYNILAAPLIHIDIEDIFVRNLFDLYNSSTCKLTLGIQGLGRIGEAVAQRAIKELDIDPGKLNPHVD